MMFTSCPFLRDNWQHLSFLEILFFLFHPLSLWMGKKDGTNLWNITQTEWWKSFSLRCSREDQKHNCKNTALMVSVIDTKAAAHKEICYVTLCTHTATQSEEFRPPLKKIAFFPLILYTNFFTVQRQTLLRNPSLFVSRTFFKCNFVSSRTHYLTFHS